MAFSEAASRLQPCLTLHFLPEFPLKSFGEASMALQPLYIRCLQNHNHVENGKGGSHQLEQLTGGPSDTTDAQSVSLGDGT